MTIQRLFKRLLSSAVLAAAVAGHSAYAQLAAHAGGNVSPGTRLSSDLGAADPSADINITVHLKLPDKAGFDKAVDALYEPGSPTFHQWLSDAELKKFAPSADQQLAVRRELESHGLTVTSVDPNGFTIRAHGPTANVAGAFQTEIHQFRHNGQTFRANIQEARLTGAAGDYVSTVAGLESHDARPFYRRALSPKTKKPYPSIPVKKLRSVADFAGITTITCLSSPATYTFQAGNTLPVGVYSGNVANSDLICDYIPSELQAVYHLDTAYKKGLNGNGQTIVLLEAYGYPNIEDDANAFSQVLGLPALTASNFKIIYPLGPPANPQSGVLLGWDGEIALDVEWAHSIAPGAKIVVAVSPGEDSEDLQATLQWVAANHLGNSVSNSYGIDTDLFAGPLEETAWNETIETAAAKGISVNFATGDGGDLGLGSPLGAPSVPSNSPYATAVGGTSIFNKPGSSSGEKITTGWGDTAVALTAYGTVLDPPVEAGDVFGFEGGLFGGSGGGESIFFAKPWWQKSLPGNGRQVPDISALADPYTGVPIVLTEQGTQYFEFGNGGTSLASPIFSAMWAIGNQYVGHPLGQAAPTLAILYNAHSPYIQDVLPTSSSSAHNVHGVIVDSWGSTTYSATDLFSGLLEGNTGFTSALFDFGGGTVLDFGFGIDTSLTVTKGWDNVTGFGTLNGATF